MTHWFALRSTPRGEFRARDELTDAGLEHFCPFFRTRTLIRHTKGRLKTVECALMPGYLFARLNFAPRSHDMRLLDGCRHVVNTVNAPSGQPVPVRERELRDLRELCMMGKFDQGRMRGHDGRFVHGDRVRITQGSWAGFVVTFRDTSSGSRAPRMGYISVMFDVLFNTRGFAMDVPQEFVEAA